MGGDRTLYDRDLKNGKDEELWRQRRAWSKTKVQGHFMAAILGA